MRLISTQIGARWGQFGCGIGEVAATQIETKSVFCLEREIGSER